MKPSQLQLAIGNAYELLKQGDAHQALLQIEALLKRTPSQPDLLHLKALTNKRLGRDSEAKSAFQFALECNPNDPQIHNNFANFLKDKEEYTKAVDHYTLALKLMPNFNQAQRNLGLCYAAQGNHTDSLKHYRAVISRDPNDVVASTALANSLRELGDYSDAEETYLYALRIRPDYVNALYNLGLSCQLNGRDSDAINYYKKALELLPDLSPAYDGLAMAFIALNQPQEAVSVLRKGIERSKDTVQLHRRLNDLLWQADDTEFGASYKAALQTDASELLLLACVDQFMHANLYDHAQIELDSFISKHGVGQSTLKAQGKLLAQRNQLQAAYETLTRALSYGFESSIAIEVIKLGLITNQNSASQALIDDLLARNPNCQLSLAYQGLLWRQLGDSRYKWLFDYDRFVRTFELPTPSIYGSSSEFIKAIEGYLLVQHKQQKTPLEQSLRNGSQTAPRILQHNTTEINAIRGSIEQTIARYIKELPSDHTHPFLRRISPGFHFSGSWSVKLRPNGYHINHVHPEGWISSSCYISIPNSIANRDSDEGCIKFGQSPFSLGELDQPDKTVRPEVATVVLFPSYIWHGTNAFSGSKDDYRLTLPFDVAPRA